MCHIDESHQDLIFFDTVYKLFLKQHDTVYVSELALQSMQTYVKKFVERKTGVTMAKEETDIPSALVRRRGIWGSDRVFTAHPLRYAPLRAATQDGIAQQGASTMVDY